MTAAFRVFDKTEKKDVTRILSWLLIDCPYQDSARWSLIWKRSELKLVPSNCNSVPEFTIAVWRAREIKDGLTPEQREIAEKKICTILELKGLLIQ